MTRTVLVLTAFLALGAAPTAQDPSPIVAEGVVSAPLGQVWAALTTAEGLRVWMAPHVEIDMSIGGLMRANYNATGSLGDPNTIENTVLAFDPPRMYALKVSKTPANFPFPNAIHRMWTVVYLEPAGEAATRVRFVGHGFGPDEESQKMRAFFDQGNRTTLKRLQAWSASAGPK